MKKCLCVAMCLLVMAPALANTVKENNYSEQLNTQTVNDFVQKKVKYTVTDENGEVQEYTKDPTGNVHQNGVLQTNGSNTSKVQQGIQDSLRVKKESYVAMKQETINALRDQQEHMAAYYDSKIAEIQTKMQRVRESAADKSEEQKNTISSFYQKSINAYTEQKNASLAKIQTKIDKLQAEIDEIMQ